MDISLYRKRLKSYGETPADVFKVSAKSFVIDKFIDHPTFRYVIVENKQYGVRLVDTVEDKIKKLLFLPDTVVRRGALVEVDDDKYLIVNFIKDDVFPRAEIELCNNILTLKTSETREITGYDDLGRPIVETTPEYTDFPCIVRTRQYIDRYRERQVNIPDGRLFITVQKTDYVISKDITFNMYGDRYKAIQVDKTLSYGDEGLIIIVADKITAPVGSD